MPNFTVHFLNVKQGDCSIIEHGSGHKTVIDVCNARKEKYYDFSESRDYFEKAAVLGNFQQKKHPVNPITYLKSFGIYDIFRFVLTHPDMDHMDGIKDFFEEFSPTNFYDIENDLDKECDESSPYRQEDWDFYKNLRDTKPQTNPRLIRVFSGDDGIHRTKNWEGKSPGDAFYVISPTPDLVKEANDCEDYNDASYVIVYWSPAGKVLFGGDSHNKSWEHILDKHKDFVSDIDLLIAPHHGRKSDRCYDFLDTLNPKMTFFGNANSEHLAYDAWRNRDLEYITNNQANCMVVDCSSNPMRIYVTNKSYAEKVNPYTTYSDVYKGYYLKEIK